MKKISAEKVLSVLSAVPETLRKLAAERDQLLAEVEVLREENNGFKLDQRIEKIAQEIHEKGIHQGRSLSDTREFLMQKHAEGTLNVVAEAISMTAPERPFGVLGEVPAGGEGSDLVSFINS